MNEWRNVKLVLNEKKPLLCGPKGISLLAHRQLPGTQNLTIDHMIFQVWNQATSSRRWPQSELDESIPQLYPKEHKMETR